MFIQDSLYSLHRFVIRLALAVHKILPYARVNHALLVAIVFSGGAGFWLSYQVRFDFAVPFNYAQQCWYLLPYVALMKAAVFYSLGGLATNWRFVGLRDAFTVLAHSIIAALILLGLWFVSESFRVPRGVIIIDCVIGFVLTGGTRLSPRLIREQIISAIRNGNGGNIRRCVIIGAGDAGEMVAREIRRNRASGYSVQAFFDDDPSKKGMLIHGIRVAGTVKDIRSFKQKSPVDTVIVAIPSATRAQMTRINDELKDLRVSVKTLPPLLEIMETFPALQQLRDINITDLLGRSEVRIDTKQVRELVSRKVVLVTGAGGSIGSELCRQVLRHDPAKLILLDHSENNLFHVHRDLSKRVLDGQKTHLVPLLCDVADKVQIPFQISKYRPHLVLHAAAHKHVNLQEVNPLQCFKNNVGGLRNLVRACDVAGVERFLLVSTDKAVNPSSVMGATKRVCELYCQAMSHLSSTKLMSVRFGNVLASEGSVVPIFLEQIRAGGPVTVTDPEVSRYFMTIPEAVTLVLQATAIGQSGQIMMLNMGEPIRIVDLARQLIELSGADLDVIKIEFTGLKEGEKLSEELFCQGEVCSKTAHEKIYIFDKRASDFHRLLERIDHAVETVEKSANHIDIRLLLREIVPDYVPGPSNSHPCKATTPRLPEKDIAITDDVVELDLKSTNVL